jgi:DNA N-6-adenine-methyltransferase Dam
MREVQNHQLINSSASLEWYTPARYLEAVREILGAIDLDPASCEAANRIVQARCYFTAADNGYMREWRGNIFLNPPYGWCYPDGRRKEKGGISSQGHWAKRLIEQYQAGNVTAAVLLINANTGEQWFQALWDFPICFVNRRIQFIPGEGTDPRKQPTKSNALVYFGPHPERFTEVFRQFGPVVTPEVLRGQVKRNTCVVCGSSFIARQGAKTCSPGCKQKSYRARVTDKRNTGGWFLPTHSNTHTPSTESAPDKASSRDEQCTPSNEAKQEAGPVTGVQTSPGGGDNDYASLPSVINTPAKYTRRRSGLASAGR